MKKSLIYTRTGDDGTTSLVGGTRIAKNSPRVNAYGTLDELNSHLGLVQAHAAMIPGAEPEAEILLGIERLMFGIGAYLATPDGRECKAITPEVIADLEHAIDEADSRVEPQKWFILPGCGHCTCGPHGLPPRREGDTRPRGHRPICRPCRTCLCQPPQRLSLYPCPQAQRRRREGGDKSVR